MEFHFDLKLDFNIPIDIPTAGIQAGTIWRTVLEGNGFVVITVNINSPDVQNIRAFGLEVVFNETTLELAEFDKGSLTEEWYALGGNEIEPGKLIVGGFMGDPRVYTVDGAGGLFSVKFKLLGGSSQVRIQNYIDDIKDMNPSVLYANVGAG